MEPWYEEKRRLGKYFIGKYIEAVCGKSGYFIGETAEGYIKVLVEGRGNGAKSRE